MAYTFDEAEERTEAGWGVYPPPRPDPSSVPLLDPAWTAYYQDAEGEHRSFRVRAQTQPLAKDVASESLREGEVLLGVTLREFR